MQKMAFKHSFKRKLFFTQGKLFPAKERKEIFILHPIGRKAIDNHI